MRIVFICGSLEPGRDGVGDYTRRLSLELTKQGHHVTALALSDGYVNRLLEEKQTIEDNDLSVLRLSASIPLNERTARTKAWITKHNPDWLSLQFVPFSFNQKGLPFYLPAFLKEVSKGKSWHIMFHELWVGMDSSASIKHLTWGWLQKRLLIKLVKELAPSVVHTHVNLYQLLLKQAGIPVKILPLFGNITLNEETKNARLSALHTKNRNRISLVHFGNIHDGAPIEDFANEASVFAHKMDIKIFLLLVGRYGQEGNRWSEIWKAQGLDVELLGEQRPSVISKVFLGSSFGLSSTPFALLQKSGSVAAMREHGLPVICVSRVWKPRKSSDVIQFENVEEYVKGSIEKCFAMKSVKENRNCITSVAAQFLQTIILKN